MVADHVKTDASLPPGFNEFFVSSYARILAHARILARNVVDAEQSVIDAYAETAKHWGQVSAYEAKEAYVRRIVRQKLGKEHRRRSRRVNAETLNDMSSQPTDPALSAEVRMVLDLIPLLPSKQRTVLALACQGYTSDEIAQELGIKPSTARTHLERARSRLRDALGSGPRHGTGRTDRLVVAASAGHGNASPLPVSEQRQRDPFVDLLHRSEAELREAFAADQARMERIRAVVAARVAGRRGRRSR